MFEVNFLIRICFKRVTEKQNWNWGFISLAGRSMKDKQTFKFGYFLMITNVPRSLPTQQSLLTSGFFSHSLVLICFFSRKKRRSICCLWTTWKCEMLRRASCPANTSLHCLTQSRGKKMCCSADTSIKWYLAEHFNYCDCSSAVSTMFSTQSPDILDLSAALLLHKHGMKGWCLSSHSWGETAPWWVSQSFLMAE